MWVWLVLLAIIAITRTLHCYIHYKAAENNLLLPPHSLQDTPGHSVQVSGNQTTPTYNSQASNNQGQSYPGPSFQNNIYLWPSNPAHVNRGRAMSDQRLNNNQGVTNQGENSQGQANQAQEAEGQQHQSRQTTRAVPPAPAPGPVPLTRLFHTDPETRPSEVDSSRRRRKSPKRSNTSQTGSQCAS